MQKNFPYGVDWEKLDGVADGLLADTSFVSNIYSILKSLLRTTLVQNKKLHSLYPISTARVIP